jgi:hypothetical protein
MNWVNKTDPFFVINPIVLFIIQSKINSRNKIKPLSIIMNYAFNITIRSWSIPKFKCILIWFKILLMLILILIHTTIGESSTNKHIKWNHVFYKCCLQLLFNCTQHMQLKSLQLLKTSCMQRTTCENMYMENIYGLNILNYIYICVCVQYNCINATLYATIANFG